MKNPVLKKSLPLILLFIIVNALLIILKNKLLLKGFAVDFILGANVLLFFLSMAGFYIQSKSVKSVNNHAFIRGVYSSVLLKMFVVIGAILIYILVAGGQVNKPAIFTSMGIYLLYTFIEVNQLMKIVRKKPNA